MYSIVLVMALSGGAEAPAFGGGRGCHGCSGSSGCYASSCHGGYSGCSSSCHGGRRGCHGRSSCHGGRRHGCHGCSGYSGCNGCHGSASYGCHGTVYGGCTGCSGTVITPAPAKMPEKVPAKKIEGSGSLTPATIVVSLPADAKLSINDAATTSSAAVRTFESPALEAGKDFHYTLKAEAVRDGQTVTTTKLVTVRGGEETRVSLELPLAGVAQR